MWMRRILEIKFPFKSIMAKPKVVIIGAGAAGISAAAKLLENGFTNLVILEAENRIGGRINSVAFDGGIVDLGAQWCHGEEDNIVYNTVKDLNLLSPSQLNYQEFPFTIYDSSGTVIDADLSSKVCGIAMNIAFDTDSLEAANCSLGDYFTNRYNKEIKAEFYDNEDHYRIAKQLLDLFHKLIICIDSAPSWFDISAKCSILYKHCDGNNYLNWKDQGYKKILQVLMKIYPNPDNALPFDHKILNQKKVNKIQWRDQLATINCTDGTVYNADHVIVTLPLGVLKQNYQTMFEPALPETKQNAIKYLGYGCSKKVFLAFPDKWWPTEGYDFNLLWKDEDRKNILKEYPHGPNCNGHSWLEDVMGFYAVDYHPRVLMVWIVGRLVSEIELLPNDIVIDGCMFLLKKFLGNRYNIPEPSDILRSSWNTNPHFYGAYSYQSVDSEKHNALPINLAEPLRVGDTDVVLFAGEATHPYYFSTVHGAIETGFREADRIINSYNMDHCGNHYQIAIIGAGIAGLGAAHTLITAGYTNVVVLEAQNELGGRIKTIPLENGFLELGAQWIHGTHNAVYNIAKEHNLLLSEVSSEGLGLYIRDDGYIYDEYLVKRVDFEVGKILEECGEFIDSTTYPYSIEDHLESRFGDYLAECNDDHEVTSMKLELLDWHLRFQAIDNSCANLKQLSAKNWGRYCCLDECYGQQHINLKNGYKSLLEVIKSNFPNDIIKYNHMVSNVCWKFNNTVKLDCYNNNEFIYCDHVIITASLGVLKEASILFDPCLPGAISKTIDCMGYHAIGKVFLIFDYKWWNTEGIQLIWRKDAWLNEDNGWTKFITGFDTVGTCPNVLLGWVGGNGISIMENLSEIEVGLHCVELLRRFMRRTDIPNPQNVIKSKWLSNKWIKGGYAFTTPECDNANIYPGSLLQPVCDGTIPRILFAGEAVHPNHFSTTHGAFESGKLQADYLRNYIEGLKTKEVGINSGRV